MPPACVLAWRGMAATHISYSLKKLERELEASKRRHPASYGKEDDDDRIERVSPNVIYFQKNKAG